MTALVTGGASGIGAAVVDRLVARGASVFVLDLGPSIERAGPRSEVHYCPTDVTDAYQVKQAVRAADQHGRSNDRPLRVAVSCAGIAPSMRLIGRDNEHDPELFGRTVAVNLLGTMHVLLYAAAAMSRNEPDGDGERGTVVNFASIAAFDGQIGQVAYAASKAGVAGMTLPAARDLAQHKIRVCAIAPGVIDTPMFGAFPAEVREAIAASVPFPRRLGHPDECARMVELVLDHHYLNGETIRLDGALRLPPR
ncbi:SDR family NAD(P)-dependent oxidoreductase [Mycobacterium saskatchewanense]|uniref:3-hydroxy-2-methylbutyryl-CoA dehydrogenase n=1 Tax=Mycobacterium saskatchewanense TaxID=220927 RepID=A0AAJ3NSX3_9MYCO|nr:SDR family NAD(P)-dependent oxidoreductase [Mycobacterium saskatchewanense]ORW73739.1 3-hydroxy-2-methylbutyryl-CoA dehydrogenase [Mycobacterium saskatchewanense]